MENSMKVPQKLKVELPYDPVISSSGYVPRRIVRRVLKSYLHTYVHSNIINNN